MQKKLLFACLLLSLTSFTTPKPAPAKILVILAHPDDEPAIGPALAKYAATAKVYYIVATDGRYGTRVKKLSPDSLITIRKAECNCSCRQLGVQPPIMLGFTDAFGILQGVGEYFKQTKAVKEKIKEQLTMLNPDIIITFGPDGDTGHSDHRIIGNIVTELLLREDWVKRYPLYYLGWTKAQAAKFGLEELNYQQQKFFNVTVHFSEEDEQKAFRSIACHQSQNTPQEITEWVGTEKKDTTNVLYFRKFVVDTTTKSDGF